MEFPPILKEMQELCRLCLADNCALQEPVHCMDEERTTLSEKIFVSTSIQMQETDYFPTKVCEECSALVSKFYKFKEKCLAADAVLRKHIRLKLQQKSEASAAPRECSSVVTIRPIKCERSYQTEEALTTGIPPTSSFKCESEMVHVVIKEEEEDIFDDSASSTSSNSETGREKKTGAKFKRKTKSKTSKFTCSLCGKSFCNKFSLTRHKWSHSKMKFTCKDCNKIFTNRESQQRHERMHEKGNRYQCHFCDKSYVSSTSHAAHVRKHTGECPYKCPECNATFYLISSFERHVVRHTGVKEYECEICYASFWVPDDLRAHVNRMH